MLTLRFAILITAFQLFVISTQPRDLVHTMERAHIPADYTLMFVIALRFIPTCRWRENGSTRPSSHGGYHPGEGFVGRIKSVAPVMVPLVSNSLARATLLGLTIDIRGYRTRKRTSLRERKMGMADKVALPLMAVTAVAFAYSFVAMYLV